MPDSTLLPRLALSLTAVLATALPAAPAHAEDSPAPVAQTAASTLDVLELTDGRRLTGEIVAENDQLVSFRSGGVLRAYARDKIASIDRTERSEAPLPPPTSEPLSKKDAKRAEKAAAKAKKRGAAAELSIDARNWLLGLLERTRSDAAADPAIRSSLAAAIQALGPAAVPDIRAAADASEGAQREFLGQIAQKIEDREAKRNKSDRAKKNKKKGEKPSDSGSGDTAMRDGETRDTAAGTGPGASTAQKAPMTAREKLFAMDMTREQGAELRDVLKTYGTTLREIYMSARDGTITRADARAEAATLRTDTMATVEGVLTAEQFAEFKTFAADLLSGRGGKRSKQGKGAKKQKKNKKGAEQASE